MPKISGAGLARGARKKFVLGAAIEVVALRTVRLSYGAVCVGVGVSLAVVLAVAVAGIHLTCRPAQGIIREWIYLYLLAVR
jgi:hypothetical protein